VTHARQPSTKQGGLNTKEAQSTQKDGKIMCAVVFKRIIGSRIKMYFPQN